jgi:hypothetical protein
MPWQTADAYGHDPDHDDHDPMHHGHDIDRARAAAVRIRSIAVDRSALYVFRDL